MKTGKKIEVHIDRALPRPVCDLKPPRWLTTTGASDSLDLPPLHILSLPSTQRFTPSRIPGALMIILRILGQELLYIDFVCIYVGSYLSAMYVPPCPRRVTITLIDALGVHFQALRYYSATVILLLQRFPERSTIA